VNDIQCSKDFFVTVVIVTYSFPYVNPYYPFAKFSQYLLTSVDCQQSTNEKKHCTLFALYLIKAAEIELNRNNQWA